MFDAKSILDALVRGGAPAQGGGQQAGLGGLGDILGQLGQAAGQGRGGAGGQGGGGGLGDILGQLGQAMGQGRGGAGAPAGQGGGLGDILKNMLPGADQQASAAPPRQEPLPMPRQGMQPRTQAQQDADDDNASDGAMGGPADILRKIQEGLGKGGQGGGLTDILGQIFGQATQGVREGAGRIDDATGASGQLKDVLAKATGKSPDEILAQLKDLIANNQLGAGAIAGGLGSVLLGTRAGRSLAANAIKLGGLALIGGLAYKALLNYQQGKPPISSGQGSALVAAPTGSGFEADAVTHDNALLLIRGMIAAAAADGRIDEKEQGRILGGLKQSNLGAGAEEFLANELNNPASVEELVQGVKSEAEAVQLFTAARVAIDLKNEEEHEFLVSLAQGLGLNGDLVQHIDAEARALG